MKTEKINLHPFESKKINGHVVIYGRLPGGLLPGHAGITFYFETRDAYTAEKHEKAIEPLLKDIHAASFDHGVYWDLKNCEAVIWEPSKQVTVASFRVRDTY